MEGREAERAGGKRAEGGNWSSRARPSTGVRSAASKCSVVWEGELKRERGGDFGGQNDNTVTPTSIATPLKSDGVLEKKETRGRQSGIKREARERGKERNKGEEKGESWTSRE